jgi:DHA1 family bicyclomycin/chloramphenicol resistance-like MFS transporter
VTVVAILGFVLITLFLAETRPAEERITVSFGSVLGGFEQLLRHGRFLGLTFIGALGMSSFFTFLASSSFIYIDHFGLTPTQFSIAFSANAAGFIGASQATAMLGMRFGMARVVTVAAFLHAAFALILLALTGMGLTGLAVLIVLLFCAFACLGLVIPSVMVLALDDHGPIAGMASALGGTLQMLTGGAMIVVVSLFFDGTTLPMVATIAACATGALALSLITLRRPGIAPQPAE